MLKILKQLNDNQNKVADTNSIMKLQAWDYGVAQDLTNKQITATVANASGFLFDIDLVSNGTEIDLDFKNSQLQKLTPDTYFLEIKVTDEAGDVSVFPTEGYATFTINNNLHATEGALVPQITFDNVLADVKKAVDEKVANYTSTIAKGDKGDTGATGSFFANQLLNTEFTPDLTGWDLFSTDGKHNPTSSLVPDVTVGSVAVGFDTTTSGKTTWTTLRQTINLAPKGTNRKFSLAWRAYVDGTNFQNYANLSFRFYDASGTVIVLSSGSDNISTTWLHLGDNGQVQRYENISIPDTAKTLIISFEAREGIKGYLCQPMLTFTNYAKPYGPNSRGLKGTKGDTGATGPKGADGVVDYSKTVNMTGDQTVAGNKKFTGLITAGGTQLTDSGWQNMILANNATATTAKYRLKNGIVYVHCRDVIANVGSIFFTMPEGYRPTEVIWQAWFSANKSGNFLITESGDVSRASSTISGTDAGTNASFEVCYPVN